MCTCCGHGWAVKHKLCMSQTFLDPPGHFITFRQSHHQKQSWCLFPSNNTFCFCYFFIFGGRPCKVNSGAGRRPPNSGGNVDKGYRSHLPNCLPCISSHARCWSILGKLGNVLTAMTSQKYF